MSGTEIVPLGGMLPSPVDHEFEPETDIFEREAIAKRTIHDSATTVMGHFRPGEPVSIILDVKRNEQLANGDHGKYAGIPEGRLLVLSQGGLGLPSGHPASSQYIARVIGGLSDEIRVDAQGSTELYEGDQVDGKRHTGVRLFLAENARETRNPQATDERVVAIEETFARVLAETAAQLEAAATQPPQDTTQA